MKKVLVLPGDGIGQDVCTAALPVFDFLKLPIELLFGDIGWQCWCQNGDPVPEETWKKIKQCDAVLLGAITSKGKVAAEQELHPNLQGTGLRYVSPVIQLRQQLELFANIRPVWHLTGPHKPFHCVVIRENTEGLYAGMDRKGIPPFMQEWIQHPNIERSGNDEAAISVRLQTRFGLKRLFHYAFNYAREHELQRVTFADKPNVLRDSGQFAADLFHEIAADYPNIHADIQNVDAVALWLVRRPEIFGVIIAENMFGDILSDLAAGVMGGLGVAPSANIGSSMCYFEPVHGSAPTMAGKGRANPAAMFLSIALLLKHLGFQEAAARIDTAVRQTIRIGHHLTYDLGGNATTEGMAQAILQAIQKPQSIQHASVLCIGNELLDGRVVNTNATEIGKHLIEIGYSVKLQMSCEDRLSSIHSALYSCIGCSDFIVISGGLGPTSDDVTRDAVAETLGLPLHLDANVMHNIKQRLSGFGLQINPLNHKQAFFPETATILHNPNGTAPGFSIDWRGRRFLVLPGPPQECLPILETFLQHQPRLSHGIQYRWLLLGVVEADIADTIEKSINSFKDQLSISYIWRYPYVEVLITGLQDGTLSWFDTIDQLLVPYLVSRDGRTALAQLQKMLVGRTWLLNDTIAGSSFSGKLPASVANADANADKDVIQIEATVNRALVPPWQGVLEIQCNIQIGNKNREYQIKVPHRGPEVIDYVHEFLAWCVLRSLNA
ncbi:3-isopropylmalate dehydrogenase [Liberibacter crescens BT-1]|uniref:3-isopropylmalate dehydrogenase n=1 Tax=Liberibacter crescens (strain BT-1) TaxID=1215343 RepID=L0EUZ2_LIBCB|nr:isocitrate/isopropylmalate dehydrogenase family protein [Liberibacter crescens]AGA64660.1 3-isopropylmalate dehydrogenase [Liberibacter crescens BT-1]